MHHRDGTRLASEENVLSAYEQVLTLGRRVAPALPPIVMALLTITMHVGCARSHERTTEEFLAKGKKFADRGDFDRAILEFRNAAQASPNDFESEFQLGETYRSMGDLAIAMRHFRRAADLNLQSDKAQLRVAELLNATTDMELIGEAERRAEAVLSNRPNDPDVLQVLALAELKLGKNKEAEAHLTSALSVSPQHVSSALTLSGLHLASGQNAEAEAVLVKMSERNEQTPGVQVALAQFYGTIGRDQDAQKYLHRALALDPANTPARLQLARLQARQGRRAEAAESFKLVSASPDKSYRALYSLFLFHTGQRHAAIAELERLLNKDRKNRELRSRLVDLYLEVGNTAKAEELIEIALGSSPNDVDALEQRARIHVMAGRLREAEQVLSEVLRVRPDSARGHYLLGQTQCATGKPLTCRKELQEAIKYEPSLLEARLTLSETLRTSGATKAALEVLDAMPPDQKNNPASATERAWVLLALGRYNEAQTEVERHLTTSRAPTLLMLSGLIAMGKKNFVIAREMLETSLRSEPGNMQALDGIAYSLMVENRMPAALERIRQHAAAHPDSAATKHLLGIWLERGGDRVGARSAYIAASRQNRNLTAATVAAARLDLLERRSDTARALIRGVLTDNPADIDGLLAEGMLEDQCGNSEAAVAAYRRLLQVQPDHFPALNNLAVILSQTSATIDEALSSAERAKEIAPDSPDIDDTIGWIYYLKGLYPTAVKYLSSAASRDNTARTHYHLAMAYVKAGNRKLALSALNKALALDPSLPESKLAADLVQKSAH